MSIVVALEDIRTFEPEGRYIGSVYEQEMPPPYPFKIDWELSKMIHDMGRMFIITARHEGVLVGHFVVITGPNMFSEGETMGHGQTIYVHPGYREGTDVGLSLFRAGEREAKRRGLDVLLVTSRPEHPIDALLERRGYSKGETLFYRRLS